MFLRNFTRFLLIALLVWSVPRPGFGQSDESVLPAESQERIRTRLAELLEYRADDWLFKQVDFWVRVFSQYDTRQGVIHDAKHVHHVFEIVDFRHMDEKSAMSFIEDRKSYWRAVLLGVQRKQTEIHKMTADELRVFRMYSELKEPLKFMNAADGKRLRFQRGLKSHFRKALARSGRYLAMMEKTFREEGVPEELTRIPFVESGFNIRAHSKVGAAGMWQFMPSTGKAFMRIDAWVDERYDPFRATRAAAKLLKLNHDVLGSWPLAVMAYNHGRSGIDRARKALGSRDIKVIMENYQSDSFQFASRNFFLEILAAIEVERNATHYFGPIVREKPVETVEVAVADYIRLGDLLGHLGLDSDVFRELNPALKDVVLSGKKRLPAGVRIHLPAQWAMKEGGPREAFWRRYQTIPLRLRHRRQASLLPPECRIGQFGSSCGMASPILAATDRIEAWEWDVSDRNRRRLRLR